MYFDDFKRSFLSLKIFAYDISVDKNKKNVMRNIFIFNNIFI